MRASTRLLAAVKPGVGKYLEPGNPTGLTGLFTHPTPRSSLLYIYSKTLDKLKQLPQHSIYRQSTEALTKQRMDIISSIKPEGYDEWAGRAQAKIEKHPELFEPGRSHHLLHTVGGNVFIKSSDGQDDEANNATSKGSGSEGAIMINQLKIPRSPPVNDKELGLEQEPALDVAQIEEAEEKLGAGLLEEVIQVAEGECKLVDTMLESQAWEELEEKAPEGQWSYFARDQHTPGTQEPPNKPA